MRIIASTLFTLLSLGSTTTMAQLSSDLPSDMPSDRPSNEWEVETPFKYTDSDKGNFIETVPFSVDIRAQYPKNKIVECNGTEWLEVMTVVEKCLNHHYFDALPEAFENVTFIMEGWDPTLFVNMTNKTLNRHEHHASAWNRSVTKRREYDQVSVQRILQVYRLFNSSISEVEPFGDEYGHWQNETTGETLDDHQKELYYNRIKDKMKGIVNLISPFKVYKFDNSTDCKFRNDVNMCHGPSDYCMFGCGHAVPLGPRNDINVTQYLNMTNTTNHHFLPISQWQHLRKYAGACVREYIAQSGTDCLGYQDKLRVELDSYFA